MSYLKPMRRRARRTKAEMNVVPYIDVMLVLLVIFMVVTPMIQTQVLNLPKVGVASTPQEPPLVIQMNNKGQLSSSGKTYANTDEMVQSVLNATQTKQRAVVLAADKAIPYGDVMAIMDTIKKSGVERVGLLLAQDKK